jgi:hypothetical protein
MLIGNGLFVTGVSTPLDVYAKAVIVVPVSAYTYFPNPSVAIWLGVLPVVVVPIGVSDPSFAFTVNVEIPVGTPTNKTAPFGSAAIVSPLPLRVRTGFGTGLSAPVAASMEKPYKLPFANGIYRKFLFTIAIPPFAPKVLTGKVGETNVGIGANVCEFATFNPSRAISAEVSSMK